VSIWNHIVAALSLTVITLNLVFWCVPLLGLALVKLAAGVGGAFPRLSGWADSALDEIYRTAVRIDDAWLKGVLGLRWESIPFELSRDRNVIVLSNHVSWADILILQSLIAPRGPILKFLAKRELLRVPIFGAIFWAFDFPIIRRRPQANVDETERRRLDLEAIHDACRVLIRRPAALVNFAEGTRFSEEKHCADSSRFQHLLEPKVGGFSALLDALEGTEVLDLTLKYPRPHSFWRFLSGDVGRIAVDAALVDSSQLPEGRERRATWLADRWASKDRSIQAFEKRNEN